MVRLLSPRVNRMDSTGSPQVVILGAGFGGLHAAFVLGKWTKRSRGRHFKITLIDRNKYHTYTPLLYEISTTSKEVANYLDLKAVTTYPIADSLKGLPVELIDTEIKNIDIATSKVELESGEINYDYLIIALGSETNFFNILGLKEKALELKSFKDALKIRDTVWERVEAASSDEVVDIVIGGAGSTGVELAGEIQEWLSQLKRDGYNCRTNVTLIDAAPSILSQFDPQIIKKATRRLKKLGARVITGETIEKVEDNIVLLKSGVRVSFNILIWTGGVKANSLISKLPLKKAGQGRMEVMAGMICLEEKPDLNLGKRVYGIGDIVCPYHPHTKKPAPMVARAAIIQGGIAAKNIIREINGKPLLKYVPKDYPYIIPVGGKYAIAKIGPIIISGLAGWITKGLVELNYLNSIMPLKTALKIWIKGLKIFIRNDRLG